MKFLPLIWAGLWRKPGRTVLTLLSVAAAFVLFGLVQGVNATFEKALWQAHLNRVYVESHGVDLAPLPIANLAQIEKVPGVQALVPFVYMRAFFKDQKDAVSVIASQPAALFRVFAELSLPPQQYEAMLQARSGAVVGRKLARRYGWDVGDRIPLTGPVAKRDGTLIWLLDIVGIFDDPQLGDLDGLTNGLLINFDYFDEARIADRGMVSGFVASIDQPNQLAQVSMAIDALFANSAVPTETRSEREFTEVELNQLGDIHAYIVAIIGSTFFTLLFLTGNTMMQSVRERIPEFGVLKTIGFSAYSLLTLVLVEALSCFIVAAALGLTVAALLYPALERHWDTEMTLPISVIAWGIGGAVILSLASALSPAWRVKRLEVVNAIAGR
jgi:putative ABC transport system permease protein